MTCGLRIPDSPTSDNLTPQEPTTQDAPDLGEDVAGLSCPGSNVVAEGARFETPDDTETIGPELTALVLSQSFTKAGGR